MNGLINLITYPKSSNNIGSYDLGGSGPQTNPTTTADRGVTLYGYYVKGKYAVISKKSRLLMG